jgi:hypothetical protein
MRTSATFCPVPLEQQPLQEYQDLRESCFFRWVTLDWAVYLRKMLWIWAGSWLIVGPIAAASFSPHQHLAQFLLSGTAGAALILVLVLLRLYLGWVYIRGRLNNATVCYEESGWYDGQTWAKPLEILARDRLIVSYEIHPILQRLHRTFAGLALLFFMEIGLWYFV